MKGYGRSSDDDTRLDRLTAETLVSTEKVGKDTHQGVFGDDVLTKTKHAGTTYIGDVSALESSDKNLGVIGNNKQKALILRPEILYLLHKLGYLLHMEKVWYSFRYHS